ncbi:hypothetical protein FHK98_18460, partial [Cylindrospermopsis raciborskii CS-506_A]
APAAAFADEKRDFKIPVPADLHLPYHERTPLAVPGGQTITTGGLVALMTGARPVVVDVRTGDGRGGTLPGALWLKGAGTLGAPIDALFGRMMEAIAPDKAQPVVFFCTGPDCWLSWNASLRAVRLGYTAVHWYRGGHAAWVAAKLPLVQSELVGNLDP